MELRYPGGEQYIRPGQAYGMFEPLAIQRQMIQRTIKSILTKSSDSPRKVSKALSFFIDAVEKYRKYDADGNQVKGDYAIIFGYRVPPPRQTP